MQERINKETSDAKRADLMEQKTVLEARIVDTNEYGRTDVSAERALKRVYASAVYQSATPQQQVKMGKVVERGLTTGDIGGLALKALAITLEAMAAVRLRSRSAQELRYPGVPVIATAEGNAAAAEAQKALSEGADKTAWGVWAVGVPVGQLASGIKGAGEVAKDAGEGIIRGAEFLGRALGAIGYAADVTAIVVNPECNNKVAAVGYATFSYILDLGIDAVAVEATGGAAILVIPAMSAVNRVQSARAVGQICK